MLPKRIAGTGLIRAGGLVRFSADSLYDYIDGAADMYLKYGVVDVHVAQYRSGEEELTADIYTFPSLDRAFGMYTTLRPDEPDTVMLGAESFIIGTHQVFTKGAHLVDVYSYDETDTATAATRALAAAIEGAISGEASKPGMFEIFPRYGRVDLTEKIHAESFLGQVFLTDVYAVDYALNGHTFTLFVTDDPGGAKLESWMDATGCRQQPETDYRRPEFDTSRYLLAADPYRGEILAGLKGRRMLGMVGHSPELNHIVVRWLDSIVTLEQE
jgi:hypothetical protein